MSLVEIQAELKAPKSHLNNFGNYNYRSCEDILEAVKPLLHKHGMTLTISDEVKSIECAEGMSIPYVEATCRLVKSDDATIITRAQAGIDPYRKGMDIAQSFGSSSSYARKYALNAMFLIDDTKDADATNDHGKKAPAKKKTAASVADEFAVQAKRDSLRMQMHDMIMECPEAEALKFELTPAINTIGLFADYTAKNPTKAKIVTFEDAIKLIKLFMETQK